ncbi:hypothetical protein R6Q59_031847 [Mikania micrantha]
MSSRLCNPFVGGPFICTFKQKDTKRIKSKLPRKACVPHAKKHDWISHGIRFCGENVEILWKNIGLRSGFVVKSVKEPFARNKTLVRSLSTVWAEGLLVFRCSVFFAVISGVCLLLWYGQLKAKTLVESKLLPSVCATLSDYIQRDLHFGKVRSISPLSITLESCSIGPHKEEFSCGEVPTLKLRFQPLISLRRGKIVIDAVLCNPTLLVAQKRNYSWLGIPFSDGGILQKHLSTEEGIDNRTKIRRIAREQTAARMDRERDDAALEAAKTGYIISSNEIQGEDDWGDSDVKINASLMDEKVHWQDHHRPDAGVEYDTKVTKHADLEKSFGANIPTAGVKFWLPGGPLKNKRKNIVNGIGVGIAAKKRILAHSASAAFAFFVDTSQVDKKDDHQIGDSYSHKHILQDADPYLFPQENSDLESKSILEDEDMETNQQLSLPSLGSTYIKDGGMGDIWSFLIAGPIQKIKSHLVPKVKGIVGELVEGANAEKTVGIEKMVPVTLDSVYFEGGTLLLLAYGDNEPREMENASGRVKFQNNYGRVHVQLSGSCKLWRSVVTSEGGGWLSTDVFVDILEQTWHANLKVVNLFVPLFERILEIPIAFYEGRASGEVHICMSQGESFPNLHGQLDVTGLAFQIFDAPSSFSDMSASLCFRAQRIFLHDASGWFGKVPLEASGDFGIEPEEGEFHLMCQVPSVEVNALMKSFKMKPLLFPLAGCVTAVFNCQGPLDAPVFVGSGLVSRKISGWVANEDIPTSSAYEAIMKNKEAGAVAAFDRVPLSYVSANFTFNTDNCVADLYGIRATLVDGGEIRGAGNAWICPEGEDDDTAMDVNLSGNLCFDKIMDQYVPGYNHLAPFKLGELNGETKLSGSLLKPRFDIKWTAPKAEGSFGDARGDMIISHEFITISSSSVAFELFTKVETSYPYENWLNRKELAVIIEGVELDLRMRNFEIFNLVSSYAFGSLRPVHLKATGRIKFQGKVVKPSAEVSKILAGDVSITGLKLNQLLLAPNLAGQLNISPACIKLDATGRPDESLAVEVNGPLQSITEDSIIGTKLSFSLLKGQLRANACYQPFQSVNLEVRHLPLDELELASLRGMLQRAEVQINFPKRRGHGILSLLQPKFSGVLGEALDVAARWSGDVITVEKAVLKQSNSQYELQGEYVLPGSRDGKKERRRSDLGSVISSMGRWRMRLEVPRAEIAEMLPLARLVSRTTDPALQFRSKDLFMQSIQLAGIDAESLQKLLEEIRGNSTPTDEVIPEELSLPGLAELKGRWSGSLDASGGGNGDTMVRGTVEQPIVDGSASFHRATISSPILTKPLTNFGGIILMDSNRLCIRSLESRVSRKGKLSVKGNLPLRTTEASLADKIDLKCEDLEVRAKNMLSGQVDTELHITGSILQPNISGNIKLSRGEAYLPHEKGAAMNREASDTSSMPTGGYNQVVASKYVSRFLNLKPTILNTSFQQPTGKDAEEIVKKGTGHISNKKPKLDIWLTDLKLVLGPELRIVYPLILNFAVSGELELNGVAHPKLLKPKGVLMFENGDVNLVATQVRLKREHLNTAKFEADNGLDPMLDLALVGSEWQFRIQSRATKWQDSLVVTSTRSVEQDVLSPSEAARVFEMVKAVCVVGICGETDEGFRDGNAMDTDLPAYKQIASPSTVGSIQAYAFRVLNYITRLNHFIFSQRFDPLLSYYDLLRVSADLSVTVYVLWPAN